MTEIQRPGNAVIEFLGATGTVTGSRFVVDAPRGRVLVDCGLFQGLKPLRERNWTPFPVDPASLDAVLVTHAHVDHSGYIPALVKAGFKGPIYATPRTIDLCGIVLPDSGHLHEEEARYSNKKGYSKHSPALPLFTREDAIASLERFQSVEWGEWLEVAPGIEAHFSHAGHILGSATIALEVEGRGRVMFSGDLGRPQHPLLLPPEPPLEADALLIESTYGDRRHETEGQIEVFKDVIKRTCDRGGVCVIPAFAVDRTEVILFYLKQLMDAGELPRVPVFVDSPMALAALAVYRRAIAQGDPELRPEVREERFTFDPGVLIEAREQDASIAIHEQNEPALIISASGMASGGRVLHHLNRRLPDPRNSVVFVGFQAIGTRGRSLTDGNRQLKLLGKYVHVAAEVHNIDGFSVHADGDELLAWLRQSPRPPETTYVVHGEEEASSCLADRIESELGWCAVTPRFRERVLVGQRVGRKGAK